MSTIGFIEMDKPTMIPQAVTEKIDNTPIAIAQAAKSRVYVVWYDNGEEYDDNYRDIDKIFYNYDDAVKYLDDCGFKKSVENGYGGEYMVWYEPYDDDYLNDARYTIREFDLY